MPTDPFFNNAATVFMTVIRHKSFTKAAVELGITQSAVSQTVAQMEKQLGFELFDRHTRPLSPTKEANVLYSELSKRSANLRDILLQLQSENYFRPLIRVGLVESLARTIAPSFLRTLLDSGRQLIIHTGTSDALYRKLLLDELDVIVATGQFLSSDALDQRFLFAEPHVILLPSEVAKRKSSWLWEDLQFCGLPLIRYTNNTASGLQGEMVLAQARLELPMTFAVDDNLVVLSLVNAGMGWSLTQPLPLLEARHILTHSTILPAPAPTTRRELFVVRKKTTPVGMMECIGRACRQCLTTQVIPGITTLIPWAAEDLVVADF